MRSGFVEGHTLNLTSQDTMPYNRETILNDYVGSAFQLKKHCLLFIILGLPFLGSLITDEICLGELWNCIKFYNKNGYNKIKQQGKKNNL